jgi:hypothetical protein
MGQLEAILAAALGSDGRRRDTRPGVRWGSATLLDRLRDLLIIFRRPVPVPVRRRRG